MADKDAPFFIGYRPFPAALARLYWAVAALFILAAGGAGYYLGAQQAAPAPGQWDTSATVTMRGILMLRPYPVLHRLAPATAGGPVEVETVLLVRQGKHSADAWARDFDRRAVAVRGYPVTRGRWKMLEIPAMDAISVDAGDGAGDLESLRAALAVESLGQAELRGEIVDSKCFLGVMKPGAGLTHKACAELCLRGGIPPILVTTDADGQQIGALLARADGGSAAVELAEFAADPVRVSGQLQRQGGLLFMRVDSVRRR